MSQENLPVELCDQVTLKLACSASEASRSLEILHKASTGIIHDLAREKQRWAETWQNQQSECAPSEDLDQPGHLPVWSESSLCAQWVAKDPSFLPADSDNTDQTGRIWVFAGRTLTLLVLSCRGSDADQTVWICRLICDFVVHKWH